MQLIDNRKGLVSFQLRWINSKGFWKELRVIRRKLFKSLTLNQYLLPKGTLIT